VKLRELFIGKPLHWVLLVVMAGVLVWLGHLKLHVREFNQFSFAVLGMTAAALLFIVVTYRKGEPVTREPLDDETEGADDAGRGAEGDR
jgi:hypothetical protein